MPNVYRVLYNYKVSETVRDFIAVKENTDNPKKYYIKPRTIL